MRQSAHGLTRRIFPRTWSRRPRAPRRPAAGKKAVASSASELDELGPAKLPAAAEPAAAQWARGEQLQIHTPELRAEAPVQRCASPGSVAGSAQAPSQLTLYSSVQLKASRCRACTGASANGTEGDAQDWRPRACPSAARTAASTVSAAAPARSVMPPARGPPARRPSQQRRAALCRASDGHACLSRTCFESDRTASAGSPPWLQHAAWREATRFRTPHDQSALLKARGRQHCHKNRGAAFSTGDELRARGDHVKDIGAI